MRIIGIDPGSRKAGFGIIDLKESGKTLHHVAHGVLYLDVEQDLSVRLKELAMRLSHIVQTYSPNKAALEEVFVNENPRSALILGQSRGAVLAVLGLAGLTVESLAPTRIKNAVTGTGRADKRQVGEMVRILLGLPKVPAQDASDALAVAIASAHAPPQLNGVVTSVRTSKRSSQQALYEIARKQGKLPNLV